MSDLQRVAASITALHTAVRSISENANQSDTIAVHQGCHELLDSCRTLFNVEVCAIFLVRGQEAVLEAQLGYVLPGGYPIRLPDLRKSLRYRIGADSDSKYDGITGLVASTGEEFSADSWEDIKANPNYAGKPDRLGIWNENRVFRGVFAVPLKLAGQTIGVLKVENKEKKHGAFSETDKILLRTLSQLFCSKLAEANYRPTKRLDDLATLANQLDFYDMGAVIDNLPRQIEVGLADVLPTLPKGPFSEAIVVGMGGSALPIDVITAAFHDRLNVPLRAVRHYDLPSSITDDQLIIASSFSGSTEETLAAIEPLERKAKNVVCVTAGGRLRTMATEREYPLIQLDISREPAGFQPRSAVGYFVAYITRVLSASNVMTDVSGELAGVPGFLRSLDVSHDAENIARWLYNKIPVIYSDEQYQSAIARTAKIKFNENSKRPAFFNALPEANHNEMIGWTTANLGNFGILYFHDPSSHPRIRKRFTVMHRILGASLEHMSFKQWDLPGETKIQKVFAALAFSERCSYNLALLDGFDPTPVDMVEEFKDALSTE